MASLPSSLPSGATFRATREALAAGWRHLRHGPLRPTWDLRTVLVTQWMRSRFYAGAEDDVQTARRLLDSAGAASRVHPGVRREEQLYAGVRCEVLTPRKARSPKDRGVIVYLHGGGYCVGSPASHRAMLLQLAKAADCAVVAVDYRLAPEHPYPAGLHDALAVVKAVRLQIGDAPLLLGGDSAGGGLAVVTAQHLARDPDHADTVQAVMLLSPWANLSDPPPEVNTDVDYLGPTQSLIAYAHHVAGTTPLDHPDLSPALHPSPRLPPTLIHVGTAERLLDHSLQLTARLRQADTPVTLEQWADQVHVWHALAALLPAGRDAVTRLGAWAHQHLRA